MERLAVATAALDFHPHHHCIGPAPDDIILHYTVAAGTFEGTGIHLCVVANSGDEWDTMRADGVMAFESRHVLRTPSDDLVYTTFAGMYDVGDDGYLDALDDALRSSARAELAIRFYTAARDYRWLNRAQFFGLGLRDFASYKLSLRIFRLDS